MPDLLRLTVRTRTTLGPGYQRNAAHQSMSAFLADWEEAHALLGMRIETLRILRDQRIVEVAAGEWPPPSTS
jgi:hypothetical protein